MASRRENEQRRDDREAAWQEHVKKDPEQDSEFARVRRLADEKGTGEGIDPRNGERAAVTLRQLYNETGDEAAAKQIFEDVARAGGYGAVTYDQALDVRGLSQSVEAHKRAAETGVDLRGRDLDKFGKHEQRQRAQHQDNLVNAVGEALRRLERG